MCEAITKSYPYHRCTNLAKYGKFCGVHRERNEDTQNLCKGITKCGKNCLNVVKLGQYCKLHLIPDNPDHDYSELALYKPDINWPPMGHIIETVKKVKTGRELGILMDRYRYIYYPVNNFYVTETSPEQIVKRDNHFTVLLMETFFVNYFLDYSSDHWQGVIADLVKKTENLKWMNEYHLLFRKKFDISFREQTKKNYIEKVLVQSDLGSDMSKKIVELL